MSSKFAAAARVRARAIAFPIAPPSDARLSAAVRSAVEPLENRRLMAASVLQYHNNAASTGVNSAETQLTPGNVTVDTFQKTFTTTVDGQVYAQPLFEPNLSVTVGGKTTTHNVTFVATEHDSLYAIDGDGGTVLWKDSFTDLTLKGAAIAGATAITTVPQSELKSGDITVETGITATPVIDAAEQAIYVETKTKQLVGAAGTPHYVHKLFKVDTHTGAVIASATIADTTYVAATSTYTYNSGPYTVGTGNGAVVVNGQSRVYFNGLRQLVRPGLALIDGKVVIASASHGDNGPYHGWVLAYDQDTLANTAAFNVTPNGDEGGIWESGDAVTVDAQGNMYVVAGNGDFNTAASNFDANGFPEDGDYSDAVLKLAFDPSTTLAKQSVNGYGIKVVDYFTPYNNNKLSTADRDVGAGGITLLPDSAGSAAHPHLMVTAGKEGKIYVIDRDDMGKFDRTTDKVVQEQANALNGSLSSPAFFNGQLFWVGAYGGLAQTFKVANGVMSTTATSASVDRFAFPGSTPSISANGTANAIAWVVDRSAGQLRAYDAASGFSKLIWSTYLKPTRDALPPLTKFAVPTVVNGRVYVGGLSTLTSYGPPAPAVAIPAAPTGVTAAAASAIAVNLAWADNSNNETGFQIQQSTDGGKTFATLATVGTNVTAYTVNNLTAGKTYAYRVAAYNERGTSTYSAAATVTTTNTPPAIDYSAGFANAAATLQTNGSAAVNASALMLTSGLNGQAGSAFTKSKVDVTKFSTAFTFRITNPTHSADGLAFVLQNQSPTAVGGSGGAMGYAGIKPSVAVKFDTANNASEGEDSTGLFTGGANPFGPSIDLSGTAINLHSGHYFAVAITYDGTTLTTVITDQSTGKSATQKYTVNLTAALGGTTAYAGFTAATGRRTATQQVFSWTLNPTPSSAPAAPTALTVVAASGTALTLNWTDNASNESGFKVYRSTDAKTYAVVANAAANATTFTDTQLLPDTHYYYKVSATNALGDSATTNVAGLVTPVPPPTPTNVKEVSVVVNSTTSATVTLSWTNNATNATGYKVLREASDATEFQQIGNLGPDATSYVDTTALPGVNYDYHIQCYNEAGYSDFAGINLTVPLSAPALTAVRSAGKAVLTWTAAAAASTFNLYRSTTAGGEGKTPYKTGLTGTAFTDVTTGSTKYYYKLTAVNKLAGEGPASTEA